VEWDGAAEFHAESAEKFTEFMKSVYASKKLVGRLILVSWLLYPSDTYRLRYTLRRHGEGVPSHGWIRKPHSGICYTRARGGWNQAERLEADS
jgi:hypothetical protein